MFLIEEVADYSICVDYLFFFSFTYIHYSTVSICLGVGLLIILSRELTFSNGIFLLVSFFFLNLYFKEHRLYATNKIKLRVVFFFFFFPLSTFFMCSFLSLYKDLRRKFHLVFYSYRKKHVAEEKRIHFFLY